MVKRCPFTLFIWCGADSATLPVLICSLGPGLSLFQLRTASHAKSECLFWSAAVFPAHKLRARQGFDASTSASAWAAGCDSWLRFSMGEPHLGYSRASCPCNSSLERKGPSGFLRAALWCLLPVLEYKFLCKLLTLGETLKTAGAS